MALVSFSGIDHPQAVAANRLRLRVMNEALPKDLKQVDKIKEEERCRQIELFMDSQADRSFNFNRGRRSATSPASQRILMS